MKQSDSDKNFNINMHEWMQSAFNVWKQMAQPGDQGKTQAETTFTGSKKTDQFFMSSLNMFQLACANMFTPENIDATIQKSDAITSATLEIMQHMTEGVMEMQNSWIERMVRIGKETKAYSFDDMDKEMFTTWKNIYEKEIQQFFQIPTLGLFRFYQERINVAIDKQNIFSEALSEFMYTLFVPVEKSAAVFQKELEEKIARGELSNNLKEYYNRWIRILEGHFMSLLKSEEYTEVLNRTISSYTQFKKAKDDVLTDFLQHIPVPTNKEMDELYKEIYELKQKVKSLQKSVNN